MKKLIAIFSACLLTVAGFAQRVTDVTARQEGNTIVVSYSIDKYAPSVYLSVSTNGGGTFTGPLTRVSGDISNVQPGCRSIVWDVLSEWNELSGDNIVFSVTPRSVSAANGHGYVDLGLSVKWATCNLGASKPHGRGHYYIWRDGSHDSARAVMGGNWRLPTREEFQELLNNCTSFWVKNFNGTGVSGRVFRSRVPGYTDKYIFLPAGGYGRNGVVTDAGFCGYYWTGTYYHDDFAWGFYFSSGMASTNSYLRNRPHLIRAVVE